MVNTCTLTETINISVCLAVGCHLANTDHMLTLLLASLVSIFVDLGFPSDLKSGWRGTFGNLW